MKDTQAVGLFIGRRKKPRVITYQGPTLRYRATENARRKREGRVRSDKFLAARGIAWGGKTATLFRK